MDFGEVLSKAWRITWKHKILWIFGIFAGCSSGGGGGGGSSGWQQSSDSGQPFSPDVGTEAERIFEQVSRWVSDNLWIFVVLAVVFLFLILLGIFLGTVGKIGLLRGAYKADGGAERLSFGELFRESLQYFWRILLLSLAVMLLALLIFIPLVLFGVITAGIGFLVALPLICILVPVFWVIGILIQLADAAIVIENVSITDGVRRGWELVKKNVGPILLIWLITAVIGGVIGIALAIPIFVMVVPLVIALAASGGQFPSGILLLGGLCFVLYLPVLIVAQGILATYVESVWALTYLRLTRPTQAKSAAEALPANG